MADIIDPLIIVSFILFICEDLGMEFRLRFVATVGLLIIVSLASCTEEMDSGSTSASAPPPDQPPQSRTVVPSQSTLGGAKRAANGQCGDDHTELTHHPSPDRTPGRRPVEDGA